MTSAPPRTAPATISKRRSGATSGVMTYSRAAASRRDSNELVTLLRPPYPSSPPPEGGRRAWLLGEDLAQLLAERRRRGVALAGVLDEALQLVLELVVLHAVRAT